MPDLRDSSVRLPDIGRALPLCLGVVGFAVTVAVWPGIPGLATAPRWAVLSIALPLLLVFIRIRMTSAHWLGLAAVGYAALSLAWAPVLSEGLNSLWRLILLAMAFCLGAEADDLSWFRKGIALGVTVSAGIALFQVNGMSPVYQYELAIPGGLFVNRNFLSEIAGMALAGTLGTWYSAGPAVALVLVHQSLGGTLAASMVVTLWAWTRWRWAAISMMVGAVAMAIAVAPQHEGTGQVRLAIWQDTAADMTLIGRGIGSYHVGQASNGSKQAALGSRENHAHNDAVELVYEFGIVAAVFGAILGVAFRAPLQFERLVLCCFLLSGLVSFPLFNPATGFMAAVVAGHLCSVRYRLRSAMVDGGTLRVARVGTF